jgi:hypothetical protein
MISGPTNTSASPPPVPSSAPALPSQAEASASVQVAKLDVTKSETITKSNRATVVDANRPPDHVPDSCDADNFGFFLLAPVEDQIIDIDGHDFVNLQTLHGDDVDHEEGLVRCCGTGDFLALGIVLRMICPFRLFSATSASIKNIVIILESDEGEVKLDASSLQFAAQTTLAGSIYEVTCADFFIKDGVKNSNWKSILGRNPAKRTNLDMLRLSVSQSPTGSLSVSVRASQCIARPLALFLIGGTIAFHRFHYARFQSIWRTRRFSFCNSLPSAHQIQPQVASRLMRIFHR